MSGCFFERRQALHGDQRSEGDHGSVNPTGNRLRRSTTTGTANDTQQTFEWYDPAPLFDDNGGGGVISYICNFLLK